jgi:hypothetical protein
MYRGSCHPKERSAPSFTPSGFRGRSDSLLDDTPKVPFLSVFPGLFPVVTIGRIHPQQLDPALPCGEGDFTNPYSGDPLAGGSPYAPASTGRDPVFKPLKSGLPVPALRGPPLPPPLARYRHLTVPYLKRLYFPVYRFQSMNLVIL